jgi:hypothetical protein
MRTLFLCISVMTVLRLDAAPVISKASTKEAWRWTNEERIAARGDAALAAERVLAARPSSAAASSSRLVAAARLSRIVDVIDGKTHPELFLPTELFETVVRDGLIWGDAWTEFYARQLSKAGLQPDFWQRLAPVVQPYLDDLRREQVLRQPGDASALREAGMYPTLCRDRFDALVNARKEFGIALDRLMYNYVATKTTMFTDDPPDPDRLRAEARGCR